MNESAEQILIKLQEMEKIALDEYKKELINLSNLHQIAYKKGKVAAINEVIQMLRTGIIPT